MESIYANERLRPGRTTDQLVVVRAEDVDGQPYVFQAFGVVRSDGPAAEANARRLAACWNACAGIKTEDLEKLNVQDALIEMGIDQVVSEARLAVAADQQLLLRAIMADCALLVPGVGERTILVLRPDSGRERQITVERGEDGLPVFTDEMRTALTSALSRASGESEGA